MINKKQIFLASLLAASVVQMPYPKWIGIYPCIHGRTFVWEMVLDILIFVGLFDIIFNFIKLIIKFFKFEIKTTAAYDLEDNSECVRWSSVGNVQRTNLLVAIFMTPFLIRWTRISLCYDQISTLKISINEIILILGLTQMVSLVNYCVLKPFMKGALK